MRNKVFSSRVLKRSFRSDRVIGLKDRSGSKSLRRWTLQPKFDGFDGESSGDLWWSRRLVRLRLDYIPDQ